MSRVEARMIIAQFEQYIRDWEVKNKRLLTESEKAKVFKHVYKIAIN